MTRFPPITRRLWWAYKSGRLPKETFDELLLGHHLEVCATCREEYLAFTAATDYEAVFERMLGRTAALRERVHREQEAAASALSELLALESEQQQLAVRQDARFRTPAIIELLLERSYRAFPAEPRQALNLAVLVEVASECSTDALPRELHVRALAHHANALRALGHLREAEPVFQRARLLLTPSEHLHVVTDLSVYALLDWWEGVFHRERSDFERAEESLDRAALLFAVMQDEDASTRVMLSLGELYQRMGNPLDALDAVRRVLSQLTEESSPDLYWIARFNHCVYLADAGSFAEARRELAACLEKPGLGSGGTIAPRVEWLQGRIASGEGDFVAAERHFTRCRQTFLAEQSGINTALVSLDLALVYLQAGAAAKLRTIAEEMALLFQAGDVHREAVAAMMLFQEAIRQEAVTARDLRRLRRYLEDTRHNPAVPFQQPS